MAYHNPRVNRRVGEPSLLLPKNYITTERMWARKKALPGYPIGAWDAHLYRDGDDLCMLHHRVI